MYTIYEEENPNGPIHLANRGLDDTNCPPPPFKSRRVLLFYCVLLFFAGFYFYHPCFCYVLKMLSMDASLATVAEARQYDDCVVDDAWAAETDPGAPKPKPKAAPKQLSMAAFLKKN